MNRNEVLHIVQENFPRDIISFDQEYPNEAFCVWLNSNGIWEVYYAEKGMKSALKTYLNESDACMDVLERMGWDLSRPTEK